MSYTKNPENIKRGRSAKNKGKVFERDLAKRLSECGYESRRTSQYSGNTGDASDVVGLPGIHIEAKHQETMRLYAWIEQAVRDAEGNGRLPAVFHKQNRKPILVTMRFEDFMKVYEGRYNKND